MNINLLVVLVVLMHPLGGNAIIRREYRIPLPLTPEEYQVGILWSTLKWSVRNTGGGEGVELLVSEPFEGETGHYSHKIFHLASKVPAVIRMLAPKGSLEIHEKSWTYMYPKENLIRTELSNPDYMKNAFHVETTTHLVQAADCNQNIDWGDVSVDTVVHLDIVNDPVDKRDYRTDKDPSKCGLGNSGLGNLSPDWQKTEVRMCVYKLVEAEFIWFGLQDTVESRLQKFARRYYPSLHRQMFCWADDWIHLSMEDIRKLEIEVKLELNKKRRNGEVRGMSEQK